MYRKLDLIKRVRKYVKFPLENHATLVSIFEAWCEKWDEAPELHPLGYEWVHATFLGCSQGYDNHQWLNRQLNS